MFHCSARWRSDEIACERVYFSFNFSIFIILFEVHSNYIIPKLIVRINQHKFKENKLEKEKKIQVIEKQHKTTE